MKITDRLNMDFGDALKYLKGSIGRCVTRSTWYGSDARPIVYLQTPDKNSKMTEPYLYMSKMVKMEDGYSRASVFPLDLSCESILAEDWAIVE